MGEAGPLSLFSIPASAAVAGRRVLKNGDSFAVFDAFGHAQATGAAAEGLFFEDTRFLSQLALTIGGQPPLLLSSAVTEGHTLLSVDLANPALDGEEQTRLAESTVHVRNAIILGPNALFAALELENFADAPVRVEIALHYAADFADIFEVRGAVRPRRGEILPPEPVPAGWLLLYRGLDRVTRRTRIAFDPPPDGGEPGYAVWQLDLAQGGRQSLCVEFHCERDSGGPARSSRRSSIAEGRRWARERRAQTASIRTDNEAFDEWLRCSRADLDMLTTETPQGLYP
ncbi:MAG: glycogen debranching N-terminal domain-containing protein, partial [Stellaceae bacterium]